LIVNESTEGGDSKIAARNLGGIVAIAASAGGVWALGRLLSRLPADFPVPVVIVQHLSPDYESRMAQILQKRTAMEVKQAEEGDKLQPGRVLIGPPNEHLLVNGDSTVTLSHADFVHFLRPSADLLFDSVGGSHQDRAVAVVLTGTGRDAAAGVEAVAKAGGVVLVQDPETAEFGGMPRAAVETGAVDEVLPLEEIAGRLLELFGDAEGGE
jgi:two-component system chemotaxis response regulator CheB